MIQEMMSMLTLILLKTNNKTKRNMMTKLCKDCKHFFGANEFLFAQCRHPSNLKIDYISGEMISRFLPQDMREIGECGNSGALWEEADKNN